MTDSLTAELQELLGDAGFMQLVECYGGLRIYIPNNPEKSDLYLDDSNLIKLARRYGGNSLRIPLARFTRARHYRLSGMSDRDIARRLGITETGVEKLFRRQPVKRPPRQPKTDPRQIDMFPAD